MTLHTVRAEPVEASACIEEPFDRLRANGRVVCHEFRKHQ